MKKIFKKFWVTQGCQETPLKMSKTPVFPIYSVYWKYKKFYSVDLTCVAIVACWGPWPDNTVTQYLLRYVFVVFIFLKICFLFQNGFPNELSFPKCGSFSKCVFIFKMWKVLRVLFFVFSKNTIVNKNL